MKFKNKRIFTIPFFMVILLFIYIIYLDSRLDYRLLLGVTVFTATIFYLFAMFEYFEVKEDKIVYANPLRRIRKEIPWDEVIRIYVLNPKGVFKAARIGYGTFGGKEITINAGLKDYKKLIKMVLDKVEVNEKVSIDVRIDDFIK
ncbi:hypothetical protein [Clostridium intestinale]|uniref:hypothetical protein n=1 Tax=Clostridium intestinale TaxID=36845 RepID=UPI002DD633D8|nr:hypothetical protein [Clostridium intestinale]WRY52641.1 hypothetical protein P8F83_05450 [Clostridium intestinale]